MTTKKFIFADLQTNSLNTNFTTINELADFLTQDLEEIEEYKGEFTSKFDLTTNKGKRELIESYSYEIIKPSQFLINQWEKQAAEAFRDTMTNAEMAQYLINKGYDILVDNEINEDAVTVKAVEFEGYEFVYKTQKWRLEIPTR